MSEALLAWHTALDEGFDEKAYQQELRDFIAKERDTAALVSSDLRVGNNTEAQKKVHAVKQKANRLYAKALSQAAFALEMALKVGADRTASFKAFDSVLMDTLLEMSAYLNR